MPNRIPEVRARACAVPAVARGVALGGPVISPTRAVERETGREPVGIGLVAPEARDWPEVVRARRTANEMIRASISTTALPGRDWLSMRWRAIGDLTALPAA